MKRRNFLATGTTSLGLPLLLNGMNLNAYANSKVLDDLYTSLVENDHILVIIQLSGGNDGLNTVIPLDQYSNYYNARPGIAIKESKILTLPDNPTLGFNPGMKGMLEMYNEGHLKIIQSIGYPNPSFSHFRSTDIWHTASSSSDVLTDGWIGRHLVGEYPGYPLNYPNSTMKDPLAIEVGSIASLGLLARGMNMGYTIGDPTHEIGDSASGDPIPSNTPAGEKLAYLRLISTQANKYSIALKATYLAGVQNFVTYPKCSLGEQLKLIARLINGGVQTKIFVTNITGFDTHFNQTTGSENITGSHFELLNFLSGSIKAFHDDLKIMGKDRKVIGMTFSEFGRRIKGNQSKGTDHGQAAPMFIFGTQVTPGTIGTNPIIPVNPQVDETVPWQTDFRSVYSSLLKRWLCQDASSLLDTMLGNFPELDLVSNAECNAPASNISSFEKNNLNPLTEESLVTLYPNPVVEITMLECKVLQPGHIMIQLLSSQGTVLRTVYENLREPAGVFRKSVNLSGLKAGRYYIRYQSGKTASQVKLIMKL